MKIGVYRRFRLLFTNLLLLLVIPGCQSSSGHSANSPVNDTTEVLGVALKEGISDRYMPGASSLYSNLSNDSVYLTSSALSFHLLPTMVSDTKFQILSQSEICARIGEHDLFDNPRYFLDVLVFEKSDTGYYVLMRAVTCGRYSSGGSLGLYLRKTGDSVVVIDRSSSSIN